MFWQSNREIKTQKTKLFMALKPFKIKNFSKKKKKEKKKKKYWFRDVLNEPLLLVMSLKIMKSFVFELFEFE